MLLMLLMLMLMLMMLLMLLTIMAGEVVWSGRSMFLPGVFSCSARRLPRYMYPGTYNELHVHVLSPSSSSSSSSSYASFPPSSAT